MLDIRTYRKITGDKTLPDDQVEEEIRAIDGLARLILCSYKESESKKMDKGDSDDN